MSFDRGNLGNKFDLIPQYLTVKIILSIQPPF